MENSDHRDKQEGVGSLLRNRRLEQDLDISEISEETKIPAKTIRAMEADDYEALPSQTFARGFYSIYAKKLGLDQEQIVIHYEKERHETSHDKKQSHLSSPSWCYKDIGTMAERPAMTIGSIAGCTILVLILTITGISWYAGYNPATELSKWLRSLKPDPSVVRTREHPPAPVRDTVQNEKDKADSETKKGPEPVSPISYRLGGSFKKTVVLKLTIDEQAPEELTIPAGTTRLWEAAERIVLELKSISGVNLTLNELPIQIPEPVAGTYIISIPEYFLDQDVNHTN